MPMAARIGDMHTCPMVTGTVPHVGGPILSPGCPTVLIGGLIAARVTDLATCVGAPDSIAVGSTTVYIGGQLAARMGDTTTHGGIITTGCPTVLIGDQTSSSGSLSFVGDCVKAAREKASKSDGEEKQKISDTADRLEQYTHDIERAKLAKHIYNDTTEKCPDGWSRYDTKDLPLPCNLQNLIWEDKDSGFKARLYKSETDNSIVLVYEGSKNPMEMFSKDTEVRKAAKADWKTNVLQGLGFKTTQYEQAKKLAKAVKAATKDCKDLKNTKLEVAGHSLGGGESDAASAAAEVKGTSFNSAAANKSNLEGSKGEKQVSNNNHYYVSGEVLTETQTKYLPVAVKTIKSTLFTTGLIFGNPALMLASLLIHNTPQVHGTQIELTFSGKGKGGISMDDSMVAKHGMDYVIQGMEEQIEKDKDTLGCSS
ncbi:MAG: PAAR domain-containing protein [Nitrospirae bacterium]|nr:PAAR domain-containing protein [Nitrospirota bacterium]